MAMHQTIKEALGFDSSEDDKKILSVCKKATAKQCKPCWEIKYCPYGPLVEDFPLLPTTLDSAIEHQEHLKSCLKSDTFGDNQPLDDERRQSFEKMIHAFDPDEHPETIPRSVEEMSCTIFGHICPALFCGRTTYGNRRNAQEWQVHSLQNKGPCRSKRQLHLSGMRYASS